MTNTPDTEMRVFADQLQIGDKIHLSILRENGVVTDWYCVEYIYRTTMARTPMVVVGLSPVSTDTQYFENNQMLTIRRGK